MLGEPRCYFFSPLPPSAIDRCGGEGGSSDVSVKAVRLRQSPAEPRKGGIKRGGERGPKGRRAGGPTASPRRDLRRAHRGGTQARAAMERPAEEDYKEKLLWNVKREVGEALAFSFTFAAFNGCFMLLITWKNPPKDVLGGVTPTLGVSNVCVEPGGQVYQLMLD